ncbi:hypothetical protein ACIBLA_15020 [Streptomyces sp. NPDC050433]|uniref:hypothetical protein n=1 Tax=Streptomyces sp. NPDC050433 TaxID=3365615 RepID=UPI00378E5BCC
MPRDKASLCVLVLAALLVTLHFIGGMVPGAFGSATHVPAPAPLAWSASVDAAAGPSDEFATCGDVGQIVDPSSSLAGRDRHRPATEPSIGGVRGDELTGLPQSGLTTPQLASRSARAAPSLAALQVFRR